MNTYQHAAFEADFSFGGVYPGSKMGAIALIRQSFLDAGWQRDLTVWQRKRGGERAEANAALDALLPVLDGRQAMVFDADDELDVVRAARITAEFDLKRAWVLGIGTEYRVLDQLPDGIGLLLPLNFPKTPMVNDAEAALELSLAELEQWRYAPYNPAKVAASGHPYALTLAGLEKPDAQFWPALRKTIKYGLTEDQALAALTTNPARFLGMQGKLGEIKTGQPANLLIADANLLSADDAQIFEVWADGARDQIKAVDAPEITGVWTLNWMGAQGPAQWTIEGKPESLKIKSGEQEATATLSKGRLLITAPSEWFGAKDKSTLEAAVSADKLEGRWLSDDGRVRNWGARRVGPAPIKDADSELAANSESDRGQGGSDQNQTPPAFPAQLRYPAGDFGRVGLPPQIGALVIRGATVWMTGADQPLQDTDVLVESGRISAVGADLAAPRGAVEVDGRGLHLTPGIIDAHSHIAGSGNINEPSHAITSEVRLGDIVDPTDINIYRELAGGTTTSHVLHGSANPIGGQAQLIKHRWGAGAEGLKFAGATPTIKFALV